MAHAQSVRRGGTISLPRLWIDSSFASYKEFLDSPPSGVPSASISDSATMTDTPFSAEPLNVFNVEPFNVICLYDFDAEDPDQLSFRRNEVLEVVKQEATVMSIRLY